MAIQVYMATHDGEGNPLSVLQKHFISFSYGGKNIEDFNLIACFSNDRLNKNIYAPFQDTTTQQQEIDGQMYWSSSYSANNLTFFLATDGMTVEEYENFKAWFIPGVERELILSEYPNRVALARVASAPVINMLPFEHNLITKIGDTSYSTITTIYKGDITLEFVMDDSYWYSIETCFTGDITNEKVKVIYEDKVPHTNMFNSGFRCLLANNKLFNGTALAEQTGISLSKGSSLYLYNCGTTFARPLIKFTFTPTISNNYINFPGNSYSSNSEYGYIKVGEKYFKFSTPSMLTGYNQAISLASEFAVNGGTSALDLRAKFRDNINHYYARAWAISILDSFINDKGAREFVDSNGAFKTGWDTAFTNIMKYYITSNGTNVYPLTIICNNKTGEVSLKGQCRVNSNGTALLDTTIAGTISSTIIEENCGDMVKSEYLYLEGGNHPTNGMITNTDCVSITSNTDLTNISFDYRYTYL